MAFEKKIWNDADRMVINAKELNRIEDGVEDAHNAIANCVGVSSVNGKTGDVQLTYEDVGAASKEEVNKLSEEKADHSCIKNAVFFGDSITHGVYSYYDTDGSRKNGFDETDDGHPRIPAYFGLLAGANVTNNGKRGSGWVNDTRKLGNGLEMTRQTDFSEYDFAAYCLGVNDYLQNVPLGALENTPVDTKWENGAASQENYVGIFPDSTARVRTGFIQPPYTIKLKDGYVIRGIAQYQNAEISTNNPAGSLVVPTAALATSYTATSADPKYPYHMISVCKTDASAAISPDEDFIEEFYVPAAFGVEGTVIGNMELIFKKIFSENPLCKVVVYSPYNTWGQVSTGGDYTSNSYYGDETTNYALGLKNSAGYTLQDLIDTIDKVCELYGIAHVPLSKSNICNRFTIKDIMIDGLHPSREARPFLAAEIYGKKAFN